MTNLKHRKNLVNLYKRAPYADDPGSAAVSVDWDSGDAAFITIKVGQTELQVDITENDFDRLVAKYTRRRMLELRQQADDLECHIAVMRGDIDE